DPCFGQRLAVTDAACLERSVREDWPLKLAYTARLLAYAPTPAALPSLAAALPDLGLAWLSKDDVVYNLAWHYYMPPLGILLVGAGMALRRRPGESSLLARWIVALAL